MSEPAKQVTIRRERGFYAILRKLIFQVDGTELLRIKTGEVRPAKLPAGAATLDLRIDWATTPPFELSRIKDGDTIVIYVERRTFRQMSKMDHIPFGIRVETAVS